MIIFAGDAPGKAAYRQELIALIARHRLTDKVRLVGHCQDMPAAFLAAHVAIMPSLVPETFGRTSVEAQAMGCPVILSEIGALPETVVTPLQDQARFTGWLVPPGDATALAGATPRGARAVTRGAGGDRRQGQRPGECRVRAFADANEDARRL